MLKLNLRKTLLTAAVLTSLCAGAVFAADAVQTPPANGNGCPAAMLHCRADGGYGYGHHRNFRPTEEQRQQWQAKRAEWQNMTPEQRQQAREQWQAEREKYREECLSKLTDEQRQQVEQFIQDSNQQRQAMRERVAQMTPEQRQALRAYGPGFRHHGKHFRMAPPADCPFNTTADSAAADK